MNQRGVVFTIIMLFIALTFIMINGLFNDVRRESVFNEAAYLNSVSNKFDNIERNLIDLDKIGYNKVIASRMLPFDYNLDKDNNSITFVQYLPFSSSRILNVFDLVNLTRIFLEDTNRDNNVFDGLQVDINVPMNNSWGGNKESIPFRISPVYYEYDAKAGNLTTFMKSPSSVGAPLDYKRIDINVLVNNADDYNSVTCLPSACNNYTDVYSPNSSLPYFIINIIDNNCSACRITTPKTISKHFNLSDSFSINISCSPSGTGACSATPIIISLNNMDWNFFHDSGRTTQITIKTVFSVPLQGFFIPDVNILVDSPNSGFSKGN